MVERNLPVATLVASGCYFSILHQAMKADSRKKLQS